MTEYTIGGAIKHFRTKKGWTQARLADEIHHQNGTYISKIETGKVDPSMTTYMLIMSVLGVNVYTISNVDEDKGVDGIIIKA